MISFGESNNCVTVIILILDFKTLTKDDKPKVNKDEFIQSMYFSVHISQVKHKDFCVYFLVSNHIFTENAELKQRLEYLYHRGELKSLINKSRINNPFMKNNWSGYSGLAAIQNISMQYPDLWEALNILEKHELTGFTHQFINRKFPGESLDYGTVALNRLQYIEAVIARDLYVCKSLNKWYHHLSNRSQNENKPTVYQFIFSFTGSENRPEEMNKNNVLEIKGKNRHLKSVTE